MRGRSGHRAEGYLHSAVPGFRTPAGSAGSRNYCVVSGTSSIFTTSIEKSLMLPRSARFDLTSLRMFSRRISASQRRSVSTSICPVSVVLKSFHGYSALLGYCIRMASNKRKNQRSITYLCSPVTSWLIAKRSFQTSLWAFPAVSSGRQSGMKTGNACNTPSGALPGTRWVRCGSGGKKWISRYTSSMPSSLSPGTGYPISKP